MTDPPPPDQAWVDVSESKQAFCSRLTAWDVPSPSRDDALQVVERKGGDACLGGYPDNLPATYGALLKDPGTFQAYAITCRNTIG